MDVFLRARYARSIEEMPEPRQDMFEEAAKGVILISGMDNARVCIRASIVERLSFEIEHKFYCELVETDCYHTFQSSIDSKVICSGHSSRMAESGEERTIEQLVAYLQGKRQFLSYHHNFEWVQTARSLYFTRKTDPLVVLQLLQSSLGFGVDLICMEYVTGSWPTLDMWYEKAQRGELNPVRAEEKA